MPRGRMGLLRRCLNVGGVPPEYPAPGADHHALQPAQMRRGPHRRLVDAVVVVIRPQ